jgi:radical SAM protein with 4Fe4S-binding SPASM domain
MPYFSRTLIHARKLVSFPFRYVLGFFSAGRFSSPKTPALSIETTSICNAACIFCANSIMKRPRQPLDMAMFRKAVDEVAAMGGTEIDFNATIGDPLLDPQLLERAAYVRRYPQFHDLGFVTTLQWLHRFPIDDFFNCRFTWLGISTTLSGRDTYRQFFGVDKYEQVLRNIDLLVEENKRRGNPIALGFSIKPTDEPIQNVLGHPDFVRLSSMVDQDLVATVRSTGLYVDDWLGRVELPSYLKKRPLYARTFRPCRLLYKGLMVYSNGKVGACSCRDFEASSELILGNITEQTIGDMWHGEKLSRIRTAWRTRNSVPEICRSCRHYLY